MLSFHVSLMQAEKYIADSSPALRDEDFDERPSQGPGGFAFYYYDQLH